MKQAAKRNLAILLGITSLILVGCDSQASDIGEFELEGPYTQAQKRAIGNCLDLAKRSVRSFGYSMPTGKPRAIARSGESDYVITWALDVRPKQYQCIVRKNGEAHKYFWG